MNKKRSGLRSLIALQLLIGFLVGTGVWMTYRESRQQQLNQQLIEAIKKENAAATLAALNAGADPNARDKTEAPTSLWNVILSHIEHIRHPRSQEADSTPSALLLAIAGENNPDWHSGIGPWRLSNQTIVENLLRRGAKVDVTDSRGWSPLVYAAWDEDAPGVRALLHYGADPYIKDFTGGLALEGVFGLKFVLDQKREMKIP